MPNQNQNFSHKITEHLIKLRKIFSLNIGTAIFGVLFLYMIVSAFMYLTSSHIESYQVSSGPLSRNETYTGLSLREESVCKADSGGYVNYYAREGSKINAGGAVYGLSSTKVPESTVSLRAEELSNIRSDMLSFSKSFSPSKFNSTYSFKYQLEGEILQYAGVTQETSVAAVTDEYGNVVSDSSAQVVTLGNQNISKAPADGIILYAKDGYEGKTVDELTAEDFNQNSYQETDVKTQSQVTTGDPVYTIITDERWSLLIPLSEKQAVKLADRTAIRVKFLKDDNTQTGDFSIITIDGSNYGKIDFSKGLIRYASDRFLDIELVTNTNSGLKIPLTSIVSKEFYTVPAIYATRNEDSSDIGFMLADKNKEGKDVTTFVTPRIYARLADPVTDDSQEVTYTYYIDKSSFKEGDAILKPDSKEKYIIGSTEMLEGVYCINQGYAVFRRVEIIDQNEEYAIVAKDTDYGLVRYDHIVKDASKVKEEDILY